MKTVPFLREHFVELAEQDAQHHSRLVGDWKAMLDHAIRPDLSFSGIENGYLIACGGIMPIWEGVAECWFFGGELLRSRKLSVVKTLVSTLAEMVREQNIRRLQAVVHCEWDEAQRFVEFLKFKQEGLLEGYGPDGSDHYMYSRIIKCPH